MLSSKDPVGYLRPFAGVAQDVRCIVPELRDAVRDFVELYSPVDRRS